MKYQTYWKDIGQSLRSSKGRFLSIFSLMLIGSMAFIGLKVAAPNMEKTAQEYLDSQQVQDFLVLSDAGLDEVDQKDLNQLAGAEVEYAYFKDVRLGGGYHEALRIFSSPEQLSQPVVVSGRMPRKPDEIALSDSLTSRYAIGDRISLSEDDKQDRILRYQEWTVTGFVRAADIWGKVNLGPSSAGAGQLTGYGYVPVAAFDSPVYLLARIRYQDLEGLPYAQASYKERLYQHQQDLDNLLAGKGNERLTRLQQAGEKELQSGQERLSSGKEQLAQAEQKLEASQHQLEEGQLAIQQGRLELDTREASLDQARQDLQLVEESLRQKKAELDAASESLDAIAVSLAQAKADLEQYADRLTQAQLALEEQKTALSQLREQLLASQAKFEEDTLAIQDQLAQALAAGQNPAELPDLVAAQVQLKQDEGELAGQKTRYQATLQAYEEADTLYRNQLATYQAAQEDYEKGESSYQTALSSYQVGRAQYQAGLESYQTGQFAYQAGQEQLAQASQLLDEKEAALDVASQELDSAKRQWLSQQAAASQELARAEQDLQKGKEVLEQLSKPHYQSYTRESQPGGTGYANYASSSSSISAVGNIFPIILYLIAALVTSMTMTRFVDEERGNIGLLKALGYSNRQIVNKFLLYGALSGLTGTLCGVLLGHFLLAPMISAIITDTTILGQSKLYVYPQWIGLAFLFSLLSSVIPAYLVAAKSLTEKPSQLLQPKPPVAGASIFLERLPFIWGRMTFTQKVTARNIVRYRKRMLMTILGVAGSVALLFAGLGIRSSISGIIDTQFGELLQYQMIVVENSRAEKSEKEEVAKALQDSRIVATLPIAYYQVNDRLLDKAESISASIVVSPEKDLSAFLHLREPRTKKALQLEDGGVILSEKLAKLYQVEVGDRVRLTLDDQEIEPRVQAVSELYAGHFIYMTAQTYQELTARRYEANADLVQLKERSSDQVQDVSARLLELKGVEAVVQNTALVLLLENLVQSLQSVMLILVLLSVLLGVVILYNLTNINMAERTRELSTIKVLGFHQHEVTLYLYRETMILSVCGILLGLAGGKVLHAILLEVIASSAILFPASLSWSVYLSPILAILVILLLLGYYVHLRLGKLDMLEALKSNE